MLAKLKHILQQTPGQWEKYETCFKSMDVPAKTVLLREGEIPSKIFLIHKGCLRAWFNNEGKDLTLQFFFEDNVVASLESFKTGSPSQLTIEAVESSRLWYITRTHLEHIISEIDKDPVIYQLFIEFILERTFSYMNLFLSFIKDTPKQRYLNLVNDRQEIIKRVPQHYIASYLGISTVHLSRIKNQILKQR